jgi:hypothetical protein
MNLTAMAAANNAAWCDTICRSHGAPGIFHSALWLSLNQVPPYYPNAVTLTGPDRSAEQLDGIRELTAACLSGGCAVKDSFGTLDLAPMGFEILFEATWIFRPPARADTGGLTPGGRCRRVTAPADLAAWERAWRGGGDEHAGYSPTFRPALLSDPDTAVLSMWRDDALIGGAIANRAAGAVGLSNVFAVGGDLDAVWAAAVADLDVAFPDLPFVGYEDAEGLASLRGLGFRDVGRLRVWGRGG